MLYPIFSLGLSDVKVSVLRPFGRLQFSHGSETYNRLADAPLSVRLKCYALLAHAPFTTESIDGQRYARRWTACSPCPHGFDQLADLRLQALPRASFVSF